MPEKTFENGETRNVPFGIDTWEEYQKFTAAQEKMGIVEPQPDPEPREAEEYGGFGRDVKRTWHSLIGQPADFLEAHIPLNAFINPYSSARDMYGEDYYELDTKDRMERIRENRAKQVSESKYGSWVNPNLEELDRIVDEDGYATERETTRGTVLEVGSYLGGGIAIARGLGRLALTSPSAYKTFASNHKIKSMLVEGTAIGTLTDQWISNPNRSIVGDLLTELNVPDSTLHTLGEYLTADEDDEDLTKRVKMLAGNLPFELVVGGLIGIPMARAAARRGKLPKDLSEEELGEMALEGLDQTKRELVPKSTSDLSSGRVVEDSEEFKQVMQQAEGFLGLRRLFQKFTQSRGYNTFKGQDAFEESEHAMRKFNSRGQHASGRLKVSIDKLVESSGDTQVGARVQQSLTSQNEDVLNALGTYSYDDKVEFLSRTFNLNDDISKTVIESRELVDELSSAVRGFAPKEIREIIDANINSYMRRSYKLFENKNYKASKGAIAKAQRKVLELLQENEAYRQANNKTYTPPAPGELERRAKDEVIDLLSREKGEFLTGDRSTIFERRKDIPKELREVMGEIADDPADALILTVTKMSKFFQRAKFLDDMSVIGKQQGFIYKNRPDDMPFLVKLENTGSHKLDGKYTTRQMEQVIQNKEISLIGEGEPANPVWKNLLSLKGFANKSATIFSITTNIRNLLGGVQFSIANGLNPFRVSKIGGENAWKTLKTLGNEARKSGDESLQKLYDEYLELGIVNTSVKVGDFRALINQGADASNVDDFMTKLSNPLSRGSERFYLASDDFFKINAYNHEYATLQRAYNGTVSVESMKREAADKVKNTLPNYDRVPPGIKALRKWPFGSFVSFRAEIIRTTNNIFFLGAKEIASGNGTLALRGAQRWAGLGATGFGLNEASDLMAEHLLGWEEDQKKAAEVLTETPWSKVNPRLWFHDEETGKTYSADTKYLDAYNTMKEPLLTAMAKYSEGRLDEEGVVKAGWDATVEAAKNLLTPFVSSAIFTKTATDVWAAANDPEGRTPDGKSMFPRGSSLMERVANSGYHILDSLTPGTLDSVDRLIGAYDEEVNPYSGDTRYDVGTEWQALLTGMRLTEFNPEEQLDFAISTFRKENSTLEDVFANYEESMGDLVGRYKVRQKERYEIQRQLYRKIQASQYFTDDVSIRRQLMDRGISRSDASDFLRGRFVPQRISTQFLRDISEKVGDSPERYSDIRSSFMSVYSDMNRTLLNTPEEEE